MIKWIKRLLKPSVKDLGIKAFKDSYDEYSYMRIPANTTNRNTTNKSITQRFNRCASECVCADGSFMSIDDMLQYQSAKFIYMLKLKLYGSAFSIALMNMIMWFHISMLIAKQYKEKKNETPVKSYKDREEEN